MDEPDDFADLDNGVEDWGADDDEEDWGAEEEEDGEVTDTKLTTSTSVAASTDPYEVIDMKKASKMMDLNVSNVAGVTNFPQALCTALLRTFGWNEEKLISKFLDSGKKILEESTLSLFLQKPSPPKIVPLECQICYDKVKLQDAYALGCGHWFCTQCWKLYLKDRLKSTGTQVSMSHCPMYKCFTRVPDSTFEKLLGKEDYEKYQDASLKGFVTQNKYLQFCQGARCERVIMATDTARTVRCFCGESFCFRCSEEAHDPVTCKQISVWNAKCAKESETAQWIISNTKKCPKCLVRIEKNQGCNHMTCQFCKHEFCWVCMGAWSEHGNHTGGFYKCNKYNPHQSKDKDESKAELDRFLHYYQRYHNHNQARKFAKVQIDQSEKRMAELYSKCGESTQWQNVQFLRKATLQVLECRKVLKFTYVYGYYCTDSKERELFEFLQEDLEKATEKLSELSEKPLESLDRQEVVDFTTFTRKFLSNLLNGLQKGLTTGK
mmetsp:Transcript_18362/g.45081  ORF Transcript_18362/g.45081 Transcript_18362/m.45081 type:complete len:493 (-) Transcript_18362:247-1725(-)|eukprot:CAMPEP_0114514766 /NCGR_PEP_ID=MMETSP0109-20121206/16339_1 /TAXON_ID=29199 /ORGANISM="Chlorarachnion reptans, Strain CCCM449" /LENGTH=492 /DNA_ID=CAMNT_0001694849 /DNA_START=141 /DNA_END=1619 /DNA_ORIENTATION=+